MRNMTVRAALALACAAMMASAVVCPACAVFNSQLFTSYGFSTPTYHRSLPGATNNGDFMWDAISRIPRDNETVSGQLDGILSMKNSMMPNLNAPSLPSGTSRSSWLYALNAPMMTELGENNAGRASYDSFLGKYMNSSSNIFEY